MSQAKLLILQATMEDTQVERIIQEFQRMQPDTLIEFCINWLIKIIVFIIPANQIVRDLRHVFSKQFLYCLPYLAILAPLIETCISLKYLFLTSLQVSASIQERNNEQALRLYSERSKTALHDIKTKQNSSQYSMQVQIVMPNNNQDSYLELKNFVSLGKLTKTRRLLIKLGLPSMRFEELTVIACTVIAFGLLINGLYYRARLYDKINKCETLIFACNIRLNVTRTAASVRQVIGEVSYICQSSTKQSLRLLEFGSIDMKKRDPQQEFIASLILRSQQENEKNLLDLRNNISAIWPLNRTSKARRIIRAKIPMLNVTTCMAIMIVTFIVSCYSIKLSSLDEININEYFDSSSSNVSLNCANLYQFDKYSQVCLLNNQTSRFDLLLEKSLLALNSSTSKLADYQCAIQVQQTKPSDDSLFVIVNRRMSHVELMFQIEFLSYTLRSALLGSAALFLFFLSLQDQLYYIHEMHVKFNEVIFLMKHAKRLQQANQPFKCAVILRSIDLRLLEMYIQLTLFRRQLKPILTAGAIVCRAQSGYALLTAVFLIFVTNIASKSSNINERLVIPIILFLIILDSTLPVLSTFSRKCEFSISKQVFSLLANVAELNAFVSDRFTLTTTTATTTGNHYFDRHNKTFWLKVDPNDEECELQTAIPETDVKSHKQLSSIKQRFDRAQQAAVEANIYFDYETKSACAVNPAVVNLWLKLARNIDMLSDTLSIKVFGFNVSKIEVIIEANVWVVSVILLFMKHR